MKKLIKLFLSKVGFKISKQHESNLQLDNPFEAISKFYNQVVADKIVFDVGVNQGQTIKKILDFFPNSKIYGFEPSKICFEKALSNKFPSNVQIENAAIGNEKTILQFNEYSWSAMNSFLTRAFGQAKIIDTYDVNVETLDSFCKENSIEKINLLKSDTEGFELNVLKGAEELLNSNKIQFILIEMFFIEHFKGQAEVGELFSFLKSKNFTLVKFYDFDITKDGMISRGDALFINQNFK